MMNLIRHQICLGDGIVEQYYDNNNTIGANCKDNKFLMVQISFLLINCLSCNIRHVCVCVYENIGFLLLLL